MSAVGLAASQVLALVGKHAANLMEHGARRLKCSILRSMLGRVNSARLTNLQRDECV